VRTTGPWRRSSTATTTPCSSPSASCWSSWPAAWTASKTPRCTNSLKATRSSPRRPRWTPRCCATPPSSWAPCGSVSARTAPTPTSPPDPTTSEGENVRIEYTITEYDEDDNEIHHEQGADSDVRYGEVEDYARGLVTEWVPVEAGAETWRARV